MAINNFKNFANSEGSQIMAQADYEKKAAVGVVPGIADPEFANKTWHQSSLIASAIGHLVANDQAGYKGVNALDSQTTEQIAELINNYVKAVINELIRINPTLARLAQANTFTQENIFNEAVTFVKTAIINGVGKNKGTAVAVDDIVNLGVLNAKITALNLAQYVTKHDTQTLNGVFTFSNPVAAPNATANNHLITKAQFDGAIGGLSALPTGSFVHFAGNAVPSGFLLCNGAAVSRTTYANLFKVIGTIYGAGDNFTTFTLPDLRNRFLEGSTVPGQYKNAGLPNITGDLANASYTSVFTDSGTYGGAFNSKATTPKTGYQEAGSSTKKDVTFSANRSSSIYGASATVQPASLTSLIIIRI